jgi:hypothetical protein
MTEMSEDLLYRKIAEHCAQVNPATALNVACSMTLNFFSFMLDGIKAMPEDMQKTARADLHAAGDRFVQLFTDILKSDDPSATATAMADIVDGVAQTERGREAIRERDDALRDMTPASTTKH